MALSQPHVSAQKEGVLGLLTLKRSAALNALDRGMVQALQDALDRWATDDGVHAVAIRGEGRAFCAGGDIQAWVREGREAALAFLAAEYRLNYRIATFPKPFLALMHGVTMGGGAGLGVHARHRLADPLLAFAMPETAIGFVPDIGGSFFLPRCPGEIGMYLALTAGRIEIGDANAAGLVDGMLAMGDFDALLEKLARGEAPAKVIDGLTARPAPGPLAPKRRHIDALFSSSSVEGVLERLARDGSEFARAAASAIRANAPESVKLAFYMLRRGRQMTLAQCLIQEYRAAAYLFSRPDLREGVRAALIDKDRSPKWTPSALAGVGEEGARALERQVPDEPSF
jgi:enoyl-CoA hydratase